MNKPRSRKIAVILALMGSLTPIAGLHKFYLKQPWWGIVYLILDFTPIPRVACALDALWYLAQDSEEFNRRFSADNGLNSPTFSPQVPTINPHQVGEVADALRELDRLRSEGLMTENEFEQKRRRLLDHIT